MEQTLQNTAVIDPPDTTVVTAEQAAEMVAGISAIGYARNVLERAGWCATIAANRTAVNEQIVAPFVVGTNGAARWLVYSITGTPPMWIVGAEVHSS